MTLNFQIRREDVLAFSREYHAASPTYQRTRTRVRCTLPVILLCLWLLELATNGFNWISTIIYLGGAALWFFLYPARFDRRVQRYAEKTIDEASYSKSFGPCERTFYWSAVDRVLLTDSYCFIFLTGPIGYPIPIVNVGREAAKAAYDFAVAHKAGIA